MARGRSFSSSWWQCLHPSYYLKRPKRLALAFISFVFVTFAVWDRQSLAQEHDAEISKLNEELIRLQDQLREVKGNLGYLGEQMINTNDKRISKDLVDIDPINKDRREKVKEAMLHAWDSYEKYAWGQDELQPQSKNGVNNFGGIGATVIDSLDTLYIMGLEDEFRRARE